MSGFAPDPNRIRPDNKVWTDEELIELGRLCIELFKDDNAYPVSENTWYVHGNIPEQIDRLVNPEEWEGS